MSSWLSNKACSLSHSASSLQLRLLGHEFNLVSTILALFVASRAMKLISGRRAVNYMPGLRVPFQPMALPGAILLSTWWNPGINFTWSWRSTFYKKFGSENVSIVPFISGVPSIYTTNLEIARQVSPGRHKTSFKKPDDSSRALLLWGMNLFSAEGELWRKHRRIVGPAFGNDLYQRVWSETIDTYHQMVAAEGWTGKASVQVPVIQKLTFKFALLVIGKCGFGFSFDWASPPTAPDGSTSVQETLRIVADNTMLLIITPKWFENLPFRKMKEARRAFNQLMNFMKEQVAERRMEIRGQTEALKRQDAFTMLVKANEDESAKYQLDDEELIGNVFVMLFAGHETTAHTFAATLGFLGLYEEIQEEVYNQIISVVGHDGDPHFEEYSQLDKVLAAFYEALRLFPAAFVMIREADEDTVLQIPNPPGQEGSTSFPVPKGLQIIVDMVGVQYNPRYFPEPQEYRPSRWYGLPSDSEQFSAFSIGARACIGRKFATTEAVAFLTMLLRDWKVEPILQEGETKEAWRQRVLDAEIVLTLGVKDVPVRLTRRMKE